MFEKLDLVDKINKELKGRGRTYIGYDFGAGYGEISVFTEQNTEPVTLLSRTDATVFHFPCMLVKHQGRFFAGYEAEALAGEADALVFEDLLDIAMNQTTIVAGGQRFETAYLLQLFLKLTLVLPESYGKTEKAGGILFTTYIDEDPALQQRVYEVLSKAAGEVFGKKTRVYLQNRSESIYYFLLHQEESLLQEDTLVCDYQKDHLKTYFVEKHGTKPPYTVSVTRMDYPDMKREQLDRELTAEDKDYLDDTFLRAVSDLEGRLGFGLTYLIGDGFKGGWLERSLNRLCGHGRVFQGNNLYSLGACCCLKQLVEPTPVLEDYVYLSSQDIPCEIGIYCRSQGVVRESTEESYLQLFASGTDYTACRRTIYLVPEGEEKLVLEARFLSRQEPTALEVDLTSLPSGKPGEGKLKVSLAFLDASTLSVEAEDVGLGQVAPGSGKLLTQVFHLDE